MRQNARFLGLLLAGGTGVFAFSGVAAAQSCSISFDQMNFGSLRSSTMASTGAVSKMTANCVGQANQTIRVCPTFQSSELVHAADPASRLKLNLYSDPGHQMPLRGGMDVVLDANGTGRDVQHVYGRMERGGSIKNGQYRAAMTVFATASYLATGALCAVNSAQERMPAVAARMAPVKAMAAKR